MHFQFTDRSTRILNEADDRDDEVVSLQDGNTVGINILARYQRFIMGFYTIVSRIISCKGPERFQEEKGGRSV